MRRTQAWSVFGLINIALMALAAAPPGRFVVSAAMDTVRDTATNLTWQRTALVARPWAQAGTYCQGLSLGGLSSGWRLPTKKELETLIDFRTTGNPSMDVTAFPASGTTVTQPYWTSTPHAGIPGEAWAVAFYGGGGALPRTMTMLMSVRCVR